MCSWIVEQQHKEANHLMRFQIVGMETVVVGVVVDARN